MSLSRALRAVASRAPGDSHLLHPSMRALHNTAAENVLAAHHVSRAGGGLGVETLQPVFTGPNPRLGELTLGHRFSVEPSIADAARAAAMRDANPIDQSVVLHHTHPLMDDTTIGGARWTAWEPLSYPDLAATGRAPYGAVLAHMEADAGPAGWQAAVATPGWADILRRDSLASSSLQGANTRALASVGERATGQRGLSERDVMRAYEAGDAQTAALGAVAKQGVVEAAVRHGMIHLDQAPTDPASLERFRPLIDAATEAALVIFRRDFSRLTPSQQAFVLSVVGGGAASGYASGRPAASQTAMASA